MAGIGKIFSMIRGWWGSLLVIIVLVSGCATYRPRPLTPDVVEQSMTPPTAAEVQVQAQTIQHPIIQPMVFDERNGLSPDEAALLSVIANPRLRAIRDQRAIAEGQVLQAGLLPNPRLGYFVSIPTGQLPSGTVPEFGGSLKWDFRTLINRSARMDTAAAHAAAIDVTVAWQEWQVAQAAKRSTYRLWTLKSQVVLAEKLAKLLGENVAQLRDALQDNLITALEFTAAETANNTAHANWLALKKQARQERVTLNRLLGFPSESHIPLQQDIHLPTRFSLPSMDRLLQGLEERRLDLVALRHGYASQEARVRTAILNQFSNIQISFQPVRDTGDFYRHGFQVWTDLPIFNRNQGNIASERATRQKLFNEYVTRVFQARNDVAKLQVGIRWLNDQVANAQEAKPILTRLVNKLQAALGGGQGTVVLYYNALTNLTTKRIRILALQQQLVEALIALELATGLYQLDAKIPAPAVSSFTHLGSDP